MVIVVAVTGNCTINSSTNFILLQHTCNQQKHVEWNLFHRSENCQLGESQDASIKINDVTDFISHSYGERIKL